jgi:hypothetical protein
MILATIAHFRTNPYGHPKWVIAAIIIRTKPLKEIFFHISHRFVHFLSDLSEKIGIA